MSNELRASAKSLSESKECFVEVYIDNRWLIIIEYLTLVQLQDLKFTKNSPLWLVFMPALS